MVKRDGELYYRWRDHIGHMNEYVGFEMKDMR